MSEQKIAPVLSDNDRYLMFSPYRKYPVGWINDFASDIEQAVLARVGAVRDQASEIQWPVIPPSKSQSHVLFEDGYAEGWAKCLAECQAAIRALKGTPAAAVESEVRNG